MVYEIGELFYSECPKIAIEGWKELVESGFIPSLRKYPTDNIRYITAKVDNKDVGVISFYISDNLVLPELFVDLAFVLKDYRNNKIMENMHDYLIKLCYIENISTVDYLVSIENQKMLNFQSKKKGAFTHAIYKHKIER